MTRFGASGRGAVILSGTQARPLEEGSFCTTEELKDSRGMSVRIDVIPGRAKGWEPCRGKGRNRVVMASLTACLPPSCTL